MKKSNTFFLITLLVSLIISSCAGKTANAQTETAEITTVEADKKDGIYDIGKRIAVDLGLTLATGMKMFDPKVEYDMTARADTFSAQGYTWPILRVNVNIKSEALANPKITFVLLLEKDKSVGTIVATLKNIRVDGKKNQALEIMHNTMYAETENGTEQVKIVNGKIESILPQN